MLMHVAVGIVINSKGQILIAQRPANKYKPGLWEFPGGKVEANESAFEALQREFAEEVAIQVVSAESWLQIQHDYGDRKVLLDTWRITEFLGEPRGAEGQPICWIFPQELKQYEFPAGNQEIIEKLLAS